MQQVTDNRSIGELFADLAQETRTLLRQELAMAKVEMSQKASHFGKGAGFVAVGGFIAYAGLLAIIAAIILGLAAFIPVWLAALIVGVVVAAIGYGLIRKGLNDMKSESLAPKRTLAGIKEDREWIQAHAR